MISACRHRHRGGGGGGGASGTVLAPGRMLCDEERYNGADADGPMGVSASSSLVNS